MVKKLNVAAAAPQLVPSFEGFLPALTAIYNPQIIARILTITPRQTLHATATSALAPAHAPTARTARNIPVRSYLPAILARFDERSGSYASLSIHIREANAAQKEYRTHDT